MTAYLEWDRNQRTNTSSVQELDRILDQLTLQATNELPFSVDLLLDWEMLCPLSLGTSLHLSIFTRQRVIHSLLAAQVSGKGKKEIKGLSLTIGVLIQKSRSVIQCLLQMHVRLCDASLRLVSAQVILTGILDT